MRGSRWKPPLEPGSYYLHDLQGLAVMGEAEGEEIIVEDKGDAEEDADDGEKQDVSSIPSWNLRNRISCACLS